MLRFFKRKHKMKKSDAHPRERWEVMHARPGYSFHHTMELTNIWLKREKSTLNKISLIDFVMDVIRKDLQTDILSSILYTKEHFRKDLPLFLFTSPCTDKNGKKFRIEYDVNPNLIRKVDLANDCIIVLPWKRESLKDKILKVRKNGFQYNSENHYAQYFKHLDICYAYNGRHSIGVGTALKTGAIKAIEVDVGLLFDHLHTNGEDWINSHTNEVYETKVFDFRFAILYELAKMKHQLQNNSLE